MGSITVILFGVCVCVFHAIFFHPLGVFLSNLSHVFSKGVGSPNQFCLVFVLVQVFLPVFFSHELS